MKPKNLLLQPSVVIAFLSLFIIQGDRIFDSIIENGFTAQNLKDLMVTVAVVSGIIVERYQEDETGTLYTNRFLPGRNFVDVNKNGVDDRLESKKQNSLPEEEGVVNREAEW